MGTDSIIRLLPTHVANKIAAGEVVDRPASVVKELVENAIDSGASQIDVEIVSGGRKLISVSDNGAGMNRDDAVLSIERQATSKIKDVDDIEKINTLGFRGEALAAIASVSRFSLTSCQPGENTGTQINISGGKMLDVKDAGCPAGTTVEVKNLFFNVPARRKFLRTQQTEMSHVRSCFITQALAHPSLGMALKTDGRNTYVLAGGGLEDRLRDLFGPEYLQNMKKVDLNSNGVTVTGYVSLPAFSRSDRQEQFVFVNSRATTAPLINYAMKEGYHTLLPDRRNPSVFLFMEMDPELVDVNVHPTKKEVRFRKPGEVRDALISSIHDALKTAEAPSISNLAKHDPQQAGGETVRQLQIEDLPIMPVFKYPAFTGGGGAVVREGSASTDNHPPSSSDYGGTSQPLTINHTKATDTSLWSWCRVLGQIGDLYVVLETEDGYVMMDPHAAHERVLFEKYMSEFTDGTVQIQNLLMPETVELGPKDASRLRDHIKLFKEMGFGIAEFGGDSFVVDALPSCFSGTSVKAILQEISLNFERSGAKGGKGRWREESIAQAACKSAVKARDILKLAEIEQLVIDLAGCDMPYTCPHGRPTMIFTSFKDLHKKFGRE